MSKKYLEPEMNITRFEFEEIMEEVEVSNIGGIIGDTGTEPEGPDDFD